MTWEYAQASHEISQAGSLLKYKLALFLEGYKTGLSKGRLQGTIGGVAGTLAAYGIYKGGIFLYQKYKQSRMGYEKLPNHQQEAPLLPAAEEPQVQEQLVLPEAKQVPQTAQHRLRTWLVLHLPSKVKQAVGLAS